LPRRVVLSPQAQRDLRRVVGWQTQPGSGTAAHRRLNALIASIDALIAHPCRCPRIDAGQRMMVVARHSVIYRVAPDTGRDETAGDVLVLRVIGPGQID
jgi:plasmid stabilization system protein ParE